MGRQQMDVVQPAARLTDDASARAACTALTREVGFSFLLSSFVLVGLDLDLGGSSLLLSSVFRVEDGVGPDRSKSWA